MDSLESLLSQALKHAASSKPLKSDLSALSVHERIKSTYGNPSNWRPGGLVELVHRGADFTLSNLGLFREAFYRHSGARRLQRFSGNPDSPARVEFVEGAHWLGPVPSPFHQYEETPQDLLALQARFEELMSEFEEVLPRA